MLTVDIIAAARAKLERCREGRPCPYSADPFYAQDYGIGHGHVCDECQGTGMVPPTAHQRASLDAIEALVETLEFAVAVKAFWQETYDANADLDIKWGEEPLERQVDAVIARAVERLRAWVEAG